MVGTQVGRVRQGSSVEACCCAEGCSPDDAYYEQEGVEYLSDGRVNRETWQLAHPNY